MAYISLYRKYRPQTFADVVGQDIIIKILKNSIKNNKINHAYIFSGPRGTGKTSVAKIFAKAVNCLNKSGDVCNECEVCNLNTDDIIDIVEIDAASNNGVDEIREIRNSIKLLPSLLKYKVYIVDEVHMLSPSAFNALLKTLEEPPSHAIFILATTEINKIPATVLSRCQKFDFKKINKDDIVNRLKYICDCEKIKIDDDILNLIAELSDGGLRDAINLLDQINSMNKSKITQTDVLNLVGSIDDNIVFDLLDKIVSGNLAEVLKTINDLYESNRNFIQIIQKLQQIIKDIIIFNNTNGYFNKEYEEKLYNYIQVNITLLLEVSEELFKLYNDLRRSNNQKIISEIIFIKITLLFKSEEKEDDIIEAEVIESDKKIENVEKLDKVNENEVIIDESEKDILINNVLSGADKELKNNFIEKFDSINDYLTDKDYNSIANLLKKSTPEVVSAKNLLFTFKNNFEVVLFDKNIDLIIKLLKQIYNKKYIIVSITEEKWNTVKDEYIKNIKAGIKYEYIDVTKKTKNKKKTTELENSIENIFGEEYKVED